MTISDLTLKLEVYQKTLEKKRQPTAPKFLDATSYTSLTSQSLSTSSTATPTSAISTTSSTANSLLSHHLNNNNAHLNSLSSSSSMSSIANSNDPQEVFIESQQHRKNSTSINLLEIKSTHNNSEKTVSQGVSQHESSPPPTISSHEASSNSSSSSASPSNHRSSQDDTPNTTNNTSSNSKEIKIIRINGSAKNENATNGGSSNLLMDASSRHVSNA